MKILLILPAWTYVLGHFSKIAKGVSFPPLNLAYLAAIAEKNGHTVHIIDGEAEQLSISQIVDRAKEFSPALIGITSTTPTFHITVELAKALKKEFNPSVSNPIIVAGGPHVTYFRDKIFYDCFDYFVIGQCEGTFGTFINALDKGVDVSNISGLLFRKNGKNVYTGDNPQFLALDELPFPARHLLKLDLYHVGTLRGRKKYTSIFASRGCPFKCVFCSTEIYGNRVRTRSVENIIQEIKHVINEYGIYHFSFLDETLTLNRKYILELCDAIEREGLKFTWEGSTRANMVDEELISKMAKCGLIRLSFGFESADPIVRKIIKKEVPLESYVVANELTNKYDIETINSVILGLPGDTYETIEKTISSVRSSRALLHATFGIAIPYPGSEMFEMAVKGEHGLKLETLDFSKYQRYDSAVMTVNGISPEELIRIQKKGLMKIYLVPWRIIPVLKRFGFIALITPFIVGLLEFFKIKKSKLKNSEAMQ